MKETLDADMDDYFKTGDEKSGASADEAGQPKKLDAEGNAADEEEVAEDEETAEMATEVAFNPVAAGQPPQRAALPPSRPALAKGQANGVVAASAAATASTVTVAPKVAATKAKPAAAK